MSKVSLKEQIEKVENQSLSGIYSKEDVLALLNDVKEDVAPDGGLVKPGLTELEVEEIVEGIKEYFKTSASNTYNAADYLEDPQFELHYGNEIGIDSVSLDGCSLIDGIADDGELVEVINASLAKAAEAQAEKDKEDDEEIVVVDVSEEESELDNELDYFAGRG